MLSTKTQTIDKTDKTPDNENPLIFLESAVKQVKKIVKDKGNAKLMLRLFIVGGGCSGFQYGFELDDQTNEDDLCIEKDGATLVIDMMSLQYLNGAAIGFQEDLTGARFIVNNPNANTTCGCGASFSI